jgi:2-keto-4-pentenoate hydratase/2-oxohepta-3-ene-1,7-dioic acid hydratase in catechol pathway
MRILKGDLLDTQEAGEQLVPLNEVALLPPTYPTKAVCIGLNYRAHAMELKYDLPDEPLMFIKPSSCVLPPNEGIVYPPLTENLHYEGELAVVIGSVAKNVKAEDASSVILGYTCANDVTARDIQKKDVQWTRGKSFDTFLPFGPWIETDIDLDDARIVTMLNGEIKQDSNINDLIFKVPELIEKITAVMTLYPGDIILTGTPSGVGPMQVGDKVMVAIEGIGELANTVKR